MKFNGISFVVVEVSDSFDAVVSRAHDARNAEFGQGFSEGAGATFKKLQGEEVTCEVVRRPATPREVARELRRRAGAVKNPEAKAALEELAAEAERQA